MKHLKTYEQNTFQKYIIIEVGTNLQIWEMLREWNDLGIDKYEMKPIFQLHKKDLIKLSSENVNFSKDFINKKILYPTNDLEDCFKNIHFIATTKNYNL